MAELANRRVLSAPIVLATPSHGNEALNARLEIDFPSCSYTTVGFIDVKGILNAHISTALFEIAKDRSITDLGELAVPLLEAATRVGQMTVLNAMGEDGGMLRIKKKKGESELSVREVIQNSILSSLGDCVYHRLAITDHKGRLHKLLSQSDIVRFLYKHPSCVSTISRRTVRDLRLGTKRVFTVQGNVPAFFVFCQLHSRGLSAAGVVSPEGALVANLSASDIRSLTPHHFSHLHIPVTRFLKLLQVQPASAGDSAPSTSSSSNSNSTPSRGLTPIREKSLHGLKGDKFALTGQKHSKSNPDVAQPATTLKVRMKPLVCCKLRNTLEECLQCVVENRVHRVYIVDDDMRPLGVITLTDILRLVVKYM